MRQDSPKVWSEPSFETSTTTLQSSFKAGLSRCVGVVLVNKKTHRINQNNSWLKLTKNCTVDPSCISDGYQHVYFYSSGKLPKLSWPFIRSSLGSACNCRPPSALDLPLADLRYTNRPRKHGWGLTWFTISSRIVLHTLAGVVVGDLGTSPAVLARIVCTQRVCGKTHTVGKAPILIPDFHDELRRIRLLINNVRMDLNRKF